MLRTVSVVRVGAPVWAAAVPCTSNAQYRYSSGSSGTTAATASASSAGSSTIHADDSSSSNSSSSSSSSSNTSSPSSSSSTSSKYADFNADRHASYPHPRKRTKLNRTLFALGWIPVAAFITSHLYSLGNVTGASMSPTFNGAYSTAVSSGRSDVVLLNRTIKVQLEKLRAGDIVTLISPLDPRLLLTKRVIALAGDTVRVWVPGGSRQGGAGRWTRIKIPPGHVWVEGDAAVDIVPGSLERAANSASTPVHLKNKSRDSREFGPVPMGLITSRIEWIVWPPERFGKPQSRPQVTSGRGQFPQSTVGQDRSTQVNPSLARILDEMSRMAPGARQKAHPEDSVVSPYVDWEEPGGNDRIDAQAAGDLKGDDEGQRRKQAWNGLSRGGRLGDDAD